MKFYIIKHIGDKWEVWSQDGSKKLGEHDTEDKAKAQLAAIEASKAKRKMTLGGAELEVDFQSDLQTIKDVDIFAIGTWRGVNSPPEGDKYEEKDLQAMVDAYNAGIVKPRIKITHGDDQEQIDVGEVANLRVNAGKLWADFVNIPKALYELMKKGLFKARSSEVMWNMKDQAGKTWGKVLKAVALLAPGQKPAVGAISEGYKFDKAYCYELPEDFKQVQVMIIAAETGASAGISAYQREFQKKEEIRKMAKLDDLIKKYGAKDEADLERILDDANEAGKRLKAYEESLKISTKKNFETFVEQAIKDGKLLPKEKDSVMQMFEGANYDETKIANVRSFIEGLWKRVDLKEHSHADQGKAKEYDKTKPPAGEVDRIANEYLREGKAKDYKQALGFVQSEFPELWKSYTTDKK